MYIINSSDTHYIDVEYFKFPVVVDRGKEQVCFPENLGLVKFSKFGIFHQGGLTNIRKRIKNIKKIKDQVNNLQSA